MITYGTNAGDNFYGADVSSFGIQVSPGDVLAIVDPGSGANEGWWAGRFTEPLFAGGQVYTQYYTDRLFTIPSTEYRSETGYDLGFRTYVDAGEDFPSVPAPGALLLAGLGVVCTAIRRRR